MINRVVLTGRLTRDLELKTTQSGLSVASFTIAVNRQFKNSNGNREADFINCVIWKKSAENLCKYTHKGSLIGIDGRLQTRSYDNKEGQRVYITEVVVDSFSLLESKNENQTNNAGNTGNGYSNNSNANTAAEPDPFADGGDTLDISDDDLPF
ncbi:MAG: hypothetical protein [Bacteriophage sp.]|nr:MAG: hypothetical protein [Bacteriophage sp.]